MRIPYIVGLLVASAMAQSSSASSSSSSSSSRTSSPTQQSSSTSSRSTRSTSSSSTTLTTSKTSSSSTRSSQASTRTSSSSTQPGTSKSSSSSSSSRVSGRFSSTSQSSYTSSSSITATTFTITTLSSSTSIPSSSTIAVTIPTGSTSTAPYLLQEGQYTANTTTVAASTSTNGPDAFVLNISDRGTTTTSEEPFARPANCTGACTSSRRNITADPNYVRPTMGCGVMTQYYGATPADWVKHDMDAWLSRWILNRTTEIRAHQGGFTGAFGQWATGRSGFTCKDDGSRSNCDYDPCTITMEVQRSNLTRQAHYVMESISRLHTYFTGLGESFTAASIGTALAQTGFAQTFYTDNKVIDLTVTREIMGLAGMTCGLIACAAGFAPIGIALGVAAIATVVGGAIGAIGPMIPITADDTPITAASMGVQIARHVALGITQYSEANDIIMAGGDFQKKGDIRNFLKNGSFVSFPGVDKELVTKQASAFLLGQNINALWRFQSIYIMGGGACGDGQGIGSGPQEAVVCRDGKAWYLYSWHLPKNEWAFTPGGLHGWIEAPPGLDKLGKGLFEGVTVQDIINSSLDSYIAAGYNYTSSTAIARARDTLTKDFVNPLQKGPGFEGVFTIPVCDVGYMVDQDLYRKEYLLQPYGGDRRPYWCGPICGNASLALTEGFIEAANMGGKDVAYWDCDSWPWSHKYAHKYYGKYAKLS